MGKNKIKKFRELISLEADYARLGRFKKAIFVLGYCAGYRRCAKHIEKEYNIKITNLEGSV